MKYTHENITEVIQNYGELMQKAESFVSQKENSRWPTVRINYDNLTIEQEVNTSCHCHPEYEWVEVVTVKEFTEWCEKQQFE